MKTILVITSFLFISLLNTTAQTYEDLSKSISANFSNANYAETLELCKQGMILPFEDKQKAEMYKYAGLCAYELDDQVAAKDFYLEAVKLGIDEPLVFDALAQLAKRQNDNESLIIVCNAVINSPGLDHQAYRLKLCSVYKKQKDGEKLLKVAEEVFQNDSSNLKALEYQGVAYKYLKDMKNAFNSYNRLYELDSENINANLFLGNYYYQVCKSKLKKSRKKYDAIEKPTRVQWHENNELTDRIENEYYPSAIKHFEIVYMQKPMSNVKKMLFTMHSKLGDEEKALIYK